MNNHYVNRYFWKGFVYILGFFAVIGYWIFRLIAFEGWDPSTVFGFLVIMVLIGVVALVIPGCYYLYMFFTAKKKCAKGKLRKGTVSNWSSGLRARALCRVKVKAGDSEYRSSALYSRWKASSMVGKRITYIILDDKLVVCDVLGE